MTELEDHAITTEDAVFTEATPELQKIAWQLNGAAWAAPMELEDYIAREIYLSRQGLSKGGGCKYWVLHRKDDPKHIIASCESIRKTVLIAGGGQGFAKAIGYGIASVYTNPKYRRLGMAGFMLRKLQEQIDQDGAFSALYSDIGKIYYAQLGWPVFPSDQATLHLLPGQDFKPTQPHRTKYLQKEELEPLCDRDVAAMEKKFEALGSDRRVHIAFSPSYDQIAWQLAREDFMTQILYKKDIEWRGAVTVDGKSWIYWDHDWRYQKLKIMRIVTSDPESEEQKLSDISVLLEAALEEASRWELQFVVVWNPDEDTTQGIKAVGNSHEESVKIIFDERTGSIASFRWQHERGVDDTVWEDNEYYCWC